MQMQYLFCTIFYVFTLKRILARVRLPAQNLLRIGFGLELRSKMLIHFMVMVISPRTFLAVIYFPAVSACFVREVRVIYPVSAVLPDDRPRVRQVYSALYLMHIVAEQLRHDIERGRHAVAVSVAL